MKSLILKVNFLILFASIALVKPHTAIGQAAQPPELTIKPVSGFTSMGQAISTLVSIVMFIGAVSAFAYLVWGAYKYVTAGDNSSNTAAARQTMLNAIIGLFLLGLVFVIFSVAVNIIPGLNQFFAS